VKKKFSIGGILLFTIGVLLMLNQLNLVGWGKSWPLIIVALGIGEMVNSRLNSGIGTIIIGTLLFCALLFHMEWHLILGLSLIGIGSYVIIRGFVKKVKV